MKKQTKELKKHKWAPDFEVCKYFCVDCHAVREMRLNDLQECLGAPCKTKSK